MNDSQASLHVVLGAGQIGTRVAEILLARGHRVRLVRRGAAGPSSGRLERVSGDITDVRFADEVARGAGVVYDCMNPPYHRWPAELLALGRGSLRAAASAGTKLVALDCLYMYGRPTGPMHEGSPLAPVSKKGELRVELAALRLEAHARGDVPVTIGRASDFFGPDLPLSAWGDRFYDRVLAGRAAETVGDPNMPHAYTYAPDVARSLVTLGEDARALGHVWHLPTNRAESTSALAARLGRALGVDARVRGVPRWMVRAVGLVSPFMRELAEMTYQWEVPFELDDTRFRTTFGYGATPVETQVADTAAWVTKTRSLRAAA